jgi:hypothetical protein
MAGKTPKVGGTGIMGDISVFFSLDRAMRRILVAEAEADEVANTGLN